MSFSNREKSKYHAGNPIWKSYLSHAQRSVFFKQMEPRLKPLAHLEEFLDSNEIVFRYNSKVHAFSAIQADYLLQNSFEGTPVYLFLARRMGRTRRYAVPFSQNRKRTMPRVSRVIPC